MNKLSEFKAPASFLIALVIIMVLAGASTTILPKTLNRDFTFEENGETVTAKFNHPMMMNSFMFVAMSLSLPVFYAKKYLYGSTLPQPGPMKMIPLALCDFCGSLLNWVGLALLMASTYQLLKMLCLVLIVLFSILIFKRSYDRVHWTGLSLTIIGLVIVSYVGTEGAEEEDGQVSGPELGLICMVFGQVFHAIEGILVETLVKGNGGCEPLCVTGWIGVWGLIVCVPSLFLVQTQPCPFHSEDACVNGHLDDGN